MRPASAAPPWPEAARWHVRVDQVLDAARWRGATPELIERFDVRQRLQIAGQPLIFSPRSDGRPAPWRLQISADFEAASDLGPEADRFEVQPDARRPALDLYHLNLQLHTAHTALQAGRVLFYDALGFDAVDGLALRTDALPHLSLHAAAGFAVRRRWLDLGPDLFSPDGSALPEEPAPLFSAGLALRGLSALDLRLDWRRHGGEVLDREQLGLATRWRAWGELFVEGGAEYDLIFFDFSELWLGAGWRPRGDLDLWVGARRSQPFWSAESIWNAFGASPTDALELRSALQLGPLRLYSDAAFRRFYDGDLAVRSPADAQARGERVASAETDRGLDAGLRLSWPFARWTHPGELGAQARLGTGYGGERYVADLFATLPLGLRPGQGPLYFAPRLGALWFDERSRPELRGTTAWALLSLRWRAAENVQLEAHVEGTHSAYSPTQLRAMTHLRLEDWW